MISRTEWLSKKLQNVRISAVNVAIFMDDKVTVTCQFMVRLLHTGQKT